MKRDTVRTALIGLSTVALVLTLGACSAVPADSGPTLSLANTKSTAQLNRNTISGKISAEITASVSGVTDASEACDNDPDGFMRRWRSTALTELTAEGSAKLDLIQQSIAGAFVSKGWEQTSKDLSDTENLISLKNPGSQATIDITATAAVEGGSGATIYVDITGPCVKTAGPGSDELKTLGE